MYVLCRFYLVRNSKFRLKYFSKLKRLFISSYTDAIVLDIDIVLDTRYSTRFFADIVLV